MCISLVYFLCFIFEFISVAVLVFALTREVWFTFGGNFAIYGTIQGYGSLWKKCFRLIDQDLQMTCENTKPSSTPGKKTCFYMQKKFSKVMQTTFITT